MENIENEEIINVDRINRLEEAVAQTAVVIDKITTAITTISTQLTNIINSVAIIQKMIDEYKAPSEYFI